MSNATLKGGCQCGHIRYQLTGEPLMTALCHCTMCRRANAAPTVAWAMFTQEQVEFTTQSPTLYASSDEARRGFCLHCGTQISFTADYISGLIDITIGSLDDPSQLPPSFHYWDSERLPWLSISDDLPRHAEFPLVE